MKNETIFYAIVLLAIIVFVALIITSSNSNGMMGSGSNNSTKGPSTLSISTTGTAYNISTEAQMYIAINGTGATNNASVQNITQTLNSFNSTISKYLNGNLSDISTEYFNVYKLYNKSGYEAEESVIVTIPNINNITAVLGALSAIPNVYISDANPILSAQQTSALRVKALSLALSNATAQAYALIGNNTIYSTNISVNTYYLYPYRYELETTSGAPVSGPLAPTNVSITPQFYGGRNSVTESITVIFAYGPANGNSQTAANNSTAKSGCYTVNGHLVCA